jgi:predicted DNA-binding WGR domain protein
MVLMKIRLHRTGYGYVDEGPNYYWWADLNGTRLFVQWGRGSGPWNCEQGGSKHTSFDTEEEAEKHLHKTVKAKMKGRYRMDEE